MKRTDAILVIAAVIAAGGVSISYLSDRAKRKSLETEIALRSTARPEPIRKIRASGEQPTPLIETPRATVVAALPPFQPTIPVAPLTDADGITEWIANVAAQRSFIDQFDYLTKYFGLSAKDELKLRELLIKRAEDRSKGVHAAINSGFASDSPEFAAIIDQGLEDVTGELRELLGEKVLEIPALLALQGQMRWVGKDGILSREMDFYGAPLSDMARVQLSRLFQDNKVTWATSGGTPRLREAPDPLTGLMPVFADIVSRASFLTPDQLTVIRHYNDELVEINRPPTMAGQ